MSFIALGVTGTVTAATAVAGASALAGVGMGAAQMASAKKGRRRAELEAQAQDSPIYKPSKSVQSYYQEAKNRYIESPYQSQEYLQGMKDINKASAEGVFGAQRLRGGLGNISKIAGTKANALQNLAIGIGSQKGQRFRDLGQASEAMGGEERMEFDINKQTPYNRKLQLAQWKAQAAADQQQAGLGTVVNALGDAGAGAAYGVFDGKTKTPTTDIDLDIDIPGSNYKKYDKYFPTRQKSLIPKGYWQNP